MAINDFSELHDGVVLINLLEIISQKSFPRYVKNPKFAAQKLANITEALSFMETNYNIKFIGCNPGGNILFQLIRFY